jgi:hypothetical protein
MGARPEAVTARDGSGEERPPAPDWCTSPTYVCMVKKVFPRVVMKVRSAEG